MSSSSLESFSYFSDTIGEIDDAFAKRSIDYRTIGSIAADALGIMPVVQSRPMEVEAINQVPDMDVLVPRSELSGAREVRKLFATRDLPVKIGLAIPAMQVDLRPDTSESYLTLGKHNLPIPTEAFDAHAAVFNTATIQSVSAETLRHIYSSLSPDNSKYSYKLRHFEDALGPDAQHDEEDFYGVFHEYADQAAAYKPISRRTMDIFDNFTDGMAPAQKARMKRLALRMADVVGWR